MWNLIKRSFFAPSAESRADSLHQELIMAVRQPEFYEKLKIPDQFEGRLECLILHSFLVLEPLKKFPQLQALSQDLVDVIFKSLEHNLRQNGVSDPRIPKTMKQIAGQFYTRLGDYHNARDIALREAFPSLKESAYQVLLQYMQQAELAFDALSDLNILNNPLPFPKLDAEKL